MQSIILTELRPEEQLLWHGHPHKNIFWCMSDILMIPLSLIWAGFIIWGIYDSIIQGAPLFFKLLAILIISLLLYTLAGPFVVEIIQRKHTYYGVTNERIVIVTKLFNRHVRRINLKTLSEISFSEHSDGSGTIVFGSIPPQYSWFERGLWKKQMSSPSFEKIEKVREVYNLICDAQKSCQ